jgi:hypothetical protein
MSDDLRAEVERLRAKVNRLNLLVAVRGSLARKLATGQGGALTAEEETERAWLCQGEAKNERNAS